MTEAPRKPTVMLERWEKPEHSEIDVKITICEDRPGRSYLFELSHYPQQPGAKPYYTDHNWSDSVDQTLELALAFIRSCSGKGTAWVPSSDLFTHR